MDEASNQYNILKAVIIMYTVEIGSNWSRV